MGTAIDDDSPGRGPARAAQGRQGAALPARVLRQPLSRRGRQAVRQDAQGPAGPARPLPGPRGPGQRAARRSRRRSTSPTTLMAMGVLVERFMKEEAAARAEFAERFAAFAGQGAARASSRSTSREPRPRDLQHQGRRRQDVGGGQPGDARRPRRARRRCCGTSTRRARARTCSACKPEGQGRRREARARQDRRRRADQGHRHRGPGPAAGGLLLPPHGPRARRRQEARRRGSTRVLEPLAGDYEYTFLDCPPSISLVSESVFEAADALLVPIIPATLSLAHARAAAQRARQRQRPAGARLLLDGRPPQEAAPRADGRASRGSTTCSRP